MTEILRPISDSGMNEWIALGSGSHYVEVDETPASDADYIYIDKPSDTESFYLYSRIGEGLYYCENETITDSYALVSHTYTLNPDTSSAWTIADLTFSTLEFPAYFGVSLGDSNIDTFGFPDTAIAVGSTINSVTLYARIKYEDNGDGTYTYYCSQYYIEIDYTTSTPSTFKVKTVWFM